MSFQEKNNIQSKQNHLQLCKSNSHTKIHGQLIQLWNTLATRVSSLSTVALFGGLEAFFSTKNAYNKKIRKVFMTGLMLFGSSVSYAQSYVFDGSNIGTNLTEGIIDTINTATNQTAFGKSQLYFGGDRPSPSGNGGMVVSLIMTNDSYDLTSIGALKITASFYNRSKHGNYNESYLAVVPNGQTTLANPFAGYPIADRQGVNLNGSSKTTGTWFRLSTTIAIRNGNFVILEKTNSDGSSSGFSTIGPVANYPYLND